MFKRIGFMALLAASLAACGGGSGDGLNYSSPSVSVTGLEAGQSVSVELGGTSAPLSFTADGEQSFSQKVADNATVTLSLTADANTLCTFSNGLTSLVTKGGNGVHKVGCGAEVVTPPDEGDSEDPTARRLALTLLNGVGTAETPVSAAQPATVQIQLLPAEGTTGLIDEVVQVTSSVGELSQSSVLTGTNGVATVTLAAGSVKGAGTITVSHTYTEDDSTVTVTRSVNFATEGDASEDDTTPVTGYQIQITLMDASGNTVDAHDAKVSPGVPLKVRATLTRNATSGVVAVSGAVVSFFSEYGVLSRASVLTDANGQAEVTLNDGSSAGAGILTVSSQQSGQTVSASVGIEAEGGVTDEQQPGVDPVVITLVLAGSDANPIGTSARPITADDSGTLSVQLVKAGAPVANEVVQISTRNGLATLSQSSVLTDDSGLAKVLVESAAGEKGADYVDVTVEHGGAVYTQSLSFATDGDDQESSEYALEIVSITNAGGAIDASNPITEQSPATVVVSLSHPTPATHPVAGQVVNLTSTLGELAQTSALTDGLGEVRVQLAAGTAKGAGTLTASYAPQGFPEVSVSRNFATSGAGTGGVQGELSIDLTLLDGGTPVSAADARVSATRSLTARATVTLDGVVQPGVVVRFASGVGSLSKGTALTDVNGVAEVTLSDGSTAGAGVLTASVEIDQYEAATAAVNVEAAGDGEPVVVPEPIVIGYSLSRGQDPANPIDGSNPGQLTVTLTKGGSAVSGEVVAFSATLGSLSQSTALTDGNGVATVEVRAGSESGAGVITITVEPTSGELYTQTVKYSVDGVQAAPEYTITPTLTGGTSAQPVSSGSPGTLQVTVLRDGAAAEGEVVTFTPSMGSLSQNSALTNGSGVVTVQVLAGTETGAGTITIEVAGQTATVNVAYQGDVPVDDGYSLQIVSINNAIGPVSATNPITEDYPATVVVHLEHSGTGDVEGKLIDVATTLGVLDGDGVNEGAVEATLLTDASGEVHFELRPSGVSGGGLITATANVGSGVEAESKSFVVHLATVGDVFLQPLKLLDGQTDRRDVPPDGFLRVLAQVTGASVANKVVVFTLNGPDGVGALDPVSGTALTDGSGVAEIKLLPGSAAGASIVTATVRIGWEGEEQSSSQSIAFTSPGEGVSDVPDVVDLALELERNGAVVTTVNEGQTVLLKVDLTSGGNPWTGEAYVEFDSRCMAAGQATINGTQSPDPVSAWGGEAQAVYIPTVGCTSDVIAARATIGTQSLLDTKDLSVTPSAGASIEFEGASPSVLGLKGSAQAGAAETSVLTFVVKNENGQAVAAGTNVEFATTGSMGGFTITSDTVVPTDSNGRVTVTVKSGSVPGVAGVKAILEGSNNSIFTTGYLSIHSGVVTQDRFVIALDTLNPGAWNHVGEQVQVTARAADRFGNWVPDGTRINFSTELGDITGSCETASGGCSVTWTSQGAQPGQDAGRAARTACEDSFEENYKRGTVGSLCGVADRAGRSTILAWTVGEESFVDANGNNLFDPSEDRGALPEAFLDVNETGDREADAAVMEQFIDYNGDGLYDLAGSSFRGVGCSDDAIAEGVGHCAELVHVRRSAVIVLATDEVEGDVSISTIPEEEGATFTATISDLHGNAPIVGSTISVEVGEGAKVFGDSSCTVPSTLEPFTCSFTVLPSEDDPSTDPISELVRVKFQSAASVPAVFIDIIPVP